MTIQYLLTLVKKTREEIVSLLETLSVSGNILIGNQLMNEESEYDIKTDKYVAKVFNMTSKGVSKNRNFLTLKSSADYVTYLDDDMYFDDGTQNEIEKMLEENQYDAVRFNVISDNADRPIKLLNKRGFVGFRQLSSFGVWGGFYKRQFLIDNKIFFNENIGPGTEINHGEDGVFNKLFLKYSKIYSIPVISFHAKQIESTWHEKHRDLEKELFSHGYNYYFLYGKSANFMSIIFLLTHMKCYPKRTKYSFLRKNMKAGIKKARENNK